jgi:hypothetical protein
MDPAKVFIPCSSILRSFQCPVSMILCFAQSDRSEPWHSRFNTIGKKSVEVLIILFDDDYPSINASIPIGISKFIASSPASRFLTAFSCSRNILTSLSIAHLFNSCTFWVWFVGLCVCSEVVDKTLSPIHFTAAGRCS